MNVTINPCVNAPELARALDAIGLVMKNRIGSVSIEPKEGVCDLCARQSSTLIEGACRVCNELHNIELTNRGYENEQS